MNKHLKAGLIAFVLGFVLGPTIVGMFNREDIPTGETTLVEEPTNWGCILIGYKCYEE